MSSVLLIISEMPLSVEVKNGINGHFSNPPGTDYMSTFLFVSQGIIGLECW